MTVTLRIIAAVMCFAFSAAAQSGPTNNVDQARAIKVASQLAVGMREEVAEKILGTNGLRNSLRAGCCHGWTRFYILADNSSLGIEIRPKSARADGAWADGLVEAALIQKNGSNIVSITFTNRP